jgi:hypothetical protein
MGTSTSSWAINKAENAEGKELGTEQKGASVAKEGNAKVKGPPSSVPFTPCGAHGIHEELPSVAISSYSLDLIP